MGMLDPEKVQNLLQIRYRAFVYHRENSGFVCMLTISTEEYGCPAKLLSTSILLILI
jgi:hypothetical protein